MAVGVEGVVGESVGSMSVVFLENQLENQPFWETPVGGGDDPTVG